MPHMTSGIDYSLSVVELFLTQSARTTEIHLPSSVHCGDVVGVAKQYVVYTFSSFNLQLILDLLRILT